MSPEIIHADCMAAMAAMPANSIDACVTDPPYGLEFMGKEWDRLGGGRMSTPGIGDRAIQWPNSRGWNETRCTHCGHLSHGGSPCQCDRPEFASADNRWREMQEWHYQWCRELYRVLKPGGYMIAFGGTRTFHRLACAVEDAGFEIRDCLAWLYGSGFPKSLNLSGGLGTALKPAFEPAVFARKPLIGTVAKNVAAFGTGALNIDACRIEGEKPLRVPMASANRNNPILHTKSATGGSEMSDIGRWPANVALDKQAAMVLDEQSGELGFSGETEVAGEAHPYGIYGSRQKEGRGQIGFGDSGGASRFFYVAKPSRAERDMGCWSLPLVSPNDVTGRKDGSAGSKHGRAGMTGRSRGNFHPTVKPVELMRWLVRLVTPIDGVILDPFLGSGTTGIAAVLEQRRFIGIEKEAEYVEIARARIAASAPLFAEPQAAAASSAAPVNDSEPSLF